MAPTTIVLVGGSGGIGAALCQHILDHSPARVIATYHREPLPISHPRLEWVKMDVTREQDYRLLLQLIDAKYGGVDWVINCVGALNLGSNTPEKSLRSVDASNVLNSIQLNTLPTLLLAKYFQSILRDSAAPRFVTLSARVGSIGDNRLGGWYSYRCSKASLNMALKNISIEWGRLMPRSCTVALHPGTTDTRLSRPFQTNVPCEQLFSPSKTAGLLFEVIQSLTPEDNGRFLAYDRSVIDW
ncbi:SDR family NAD(P)-dependent oxidoreductase [Vibrio parahaemolyticus]|uniref:SDR family NAD(P)-dependent oxidoreductase n=1 Tax=Vibrio mediterranei TaxID=689 RepID=UPI004068BECC